MMNHDGPGPWSGNWTPWNTEQSTKLVFSYLQQSSAGSNSKVLISGVLVK